MTDINYPPTRTLVLGVAAEALAQDHDDAEDRIASLDDDATQQRREAIADRNSAQAQHEAVTWAINEFGDDAEIQLRAFTATHRARVLDTINQTVVGQVGSEETRTWLVAGSIKSAPWLDGDESLREQAELTGALPPALIDWLDAELDDLNDLSEGN